MVSEILKDEYHGKYEVVSKKDYESNMVKYSDSTKYQYVLRITSSISTHVNVQTNENTNFLHVYYLVEGRMENKNYRCPAEVNWYDHVMKVYIQRLEQQRKKNQGS